MKNPHATELGKLGGKSRAKSLTKERLKEIASMGGKSKSTAKLKAVRENLKKANEARKNNLKRKNNET